MTPKEHEFKEGEWAWSHRDGWAQVSKAYADYPEDRYQTIRHADKLYSTTGKYLAQDVFPSLLTEEQANKLGYFREKKKVKKTISKWIVVSECGRITSLLCDQESYARGCADKYTLDGDEIYYAVELKGTYEVEE